jgi:hypothetical protein
VRVEKIGYPVIAETATLTTFARGDKEGVIARGNNSEAISISTKNNIVGATLGVAQNNKRGRVKPCPYIYGETATLTTFARGDRERVMDRENFPLYFKFHAKTYRAG